jgi:uncharacterized protein (UPF0276 family)
MVLGPEGRLIMKPVNNAFMTYQGVGVGLRSAHHSQFIDERPSSVTWVEVISENFLPWQERGFTKSFQLLQKVRQDYPVALHGVSLNLGSADPIDFDYLRRLQTLVAEVEPFAVSDHLAWTGVDGLNMHDLLPIPYTHEALEFIAQKVEQVQTFLKRPILIENPSSYLSYNTSEMSEPEFVSALSRKTGCGILLDVNNVYVSSVNHGFNPLAYLEQLPFDHVGQMHLAGHSNREGFLIDTHDAPVCAEVWRIYQWCVDRFGVCSTMIERDGNIPSWGELEEELLKLRSLHEKA